jgi:hypothetical protein
MKDEMSNEKGCPRLAKPEIVVYDTIMITGNNAPAPVGIFIIRTGRIT